MADPQFDPAKPFTAAPSFDPAQPFTAAPPDFTATSLPLPDVSAHAGVPARGRGTQFDLDKANRGYDLATTPLARPTGVDAIDGFTSPVGLLSLGAGGVSIARAGMTGGAMAAAKTAIADASPMIKYEVARSTLMHFGVPYEIATPLAMALSGIKKGAKAAAAEAPEHVSRPGYPRETVTPPPEPPAAPGAAPTEFQAAQAARQANTLPDQKALNEAAIARRRAEYAARQSPASEAPVPASGKLHFTAPEWAEFQRLRKQGMSLEKAADGALAASALARQLGSATPAEVASAVASRKATGKW